MTALWTAAEAAEATQGQAIGDWAVNGVSIDTRTIQPGDLFVALTAARDGHDFVADALAKGAGAALVSRVPDGVAEDAPLLLVKDVLSGLEDLGRAARRRMTGKVVAVTGSVGKTSTKEMLRTVLGGQGRVHAAEASYNNHWGVPLTLARMPRDTEYAVIEIGMNNPGEIAPLSQMARPHVAVVTIVAPAHLAAFDGLDGIAREKASVFSGLEPNGIAIYNGDLPVSDILHDAAKAQAKRLISFGQAASNHHRVTDVKIHDTCTVARGRAWRMPVLYKVHAPGRHYVVNAMAVIAVASALKLDRSLAANDLGRWQPGAGRGMRQVVQLDPVETEMTLELIDDAYNANPASLGAALEVLAAASARDGMGRISRGRRVACLGDMKELGKDEARLHAEIAALPSIEKIDVVHCVGPLMRHLWEALPQRIQGRYAKTAQEMSERLPHDLDAGDVVLVKGSNSLHLSRVVDAIRKMGQGRSSLVPEEE